VALFILGGADAIDAFAARRRVARRAAQGRLDSDSRRGSSRQSSSERESTQLHDRAAPRTRTATARTTILRPVAEVYSLFRNYTNYPRFMGLFMGHLDSVEADATGRTRWRLRTFAGRSVEFEAELFEEEPGRVLVWRTVPGSEVDHRGVLRFEPAPRGRGTELHVEIEYKSPARGLGALVAKLFGFEPGQQARGDLRRLKQLLETGEVVHSDESIHGQGQGLGGLGGLGRLFHSAQPPSDEVYRRHARYVPGQPTMRGEAA
jgi:uncharacterized membrane protein